MYRERFINSQIVVYAGEAYLFRGFSALDYFDLEGERWGRIQTHFLHHHGGRDEWPWSQGHGSLTDYVACVVHGHMYVFGGSLKRAVGSNFFAVLDIEKKTWKRLSGGTDRESIVPSHDVPGVRKNLASGVLGGLEGREGIYHVWPA